MPEIVRNLAIAEFLSRLGIKTWLGKLGLRPPTKYAIIITDIVLIT